MSEIGVASNLTHYSAESDYISYTIIMKNVLDSNSYGNGIGNIDDELYETPLQLINMGFPSTLDQIINLFGINNVSISYSISYSGNIDSSNCECPYYMYLTLPPSSDTPTTILSIPAYSQFVQSPSWIRFTPQYSFMTELTLDVTSTYDPTGCMKCKVAPQFTNSRFDVKVDVTINVINYCLAPEKKNITNDACYNYITNYMPISKFSKSMLLRSSAVQNIIYFTDCFIYCLVD